MLGWRILPPLQTGQHDGVGTVLQPRQFYGQPAAKKRKRGTSDELRRTNCGRSFAAQSGETAGALALAPFLTQDLIWKARLQLPASRLCGLNDKHTPALEQHGRHGFRAESRLVTLQRQTARPRNHSTASPDNETVLKTNMQANTECSIAHAHSFQTSVCVCVCLVVGGVIDGVIYGQRKKMVMLRKQQSVCYNLTCNSSGGTVRRGLQDGAVSGCTCGCVVNRMVACECV